MVMPSVLQFIFEKYIYSESKILSLLPIDGLMENAVPFSSTTGDQENSAG